MRDVTNLAAYRSRRALQNVIDRYTEQELDGFWDEAVRRRGEPGYEGMRGAEPSWVMVDEIHHWTENNTAFEQLRREYLNHLVWVEPTPERRRESERVLRILRGTDHGSDDGNAEGHRDDPGVPRG